MVRIHELQRNGNTHGSKAPARLPGERSDANLAGMFDVAETIHRLCNESTVALEPTPSENSLPTAIPNTQVSCSDSRPLVDSLPTFDLLSKSCLHSITQFLSQFRRAPVGLLIVSKSGKVLQSSQSGWNASIFQEQNRLLAKVAKESIWRPALRFSSLPATEPKNSSIAPASEEEHLTISQSVLVQSLSQKLGTPLATIPFSLGNSPYYALFLCQPAGVGQENSSLETPESIRWLGLDPTRVEQLLRQLQAWAVMSQCERFAKALSLIERVRSQPCSWLVTLGLAIAVLLTPVPYRPQRDCTFEPEVKQFLSSPIQGRIASCEVRLGDQVTAGQLLAHLDDDQLQRDLADAQAAYDGALQKRDSALATRATGNAGIANIEMEQAQWKIESIQDRLKRLEIRARAPGIVVQGDWHRSIGSPVTLGQNLFEVAELDSMTAELRLTASDLEQIHVGDETTIWSDASNVATFRGKISRIEPRATVIDDQAVFIADVVVNNREFHLRPGMKAKSRIDAGWKSIGWLLFHRPYRWVASQWIW